MKVALIIEIIVVLTIVFLSVESIAVYLFTKNSNVAMSDNRIVIGIILAILSIYVFFAEDRINNPGGMIWPIIFIGGTSLLNLIIYNFPRVTYDDNEIVTFTFLFHLNRFLYSDITGIKWGKNGDYVLYFGKFKLYIDETAIGGTDFLRQVFQKREEQLHQRIPEIKNKLFHGYFVNAKELLIAYMLVPAFATVCFFAIGEKVGKYPEKMNSISMQFDTCIVEKEELLLSNNTISLKTRKCDADTTVSIMGAVEQKKTLTINYVKSSESLKRKEGVDGIIWSLSDGPELLISTEETLSVSDASAIQILWILGILAFIGWILFFAICYVLNNAPRYKKLVKILVKKENWRF